MAGNENVAKTIVLNDENYSEILKNTEIPVLMEFWAPWCHHCRALSPALDATAAELAGQVLIGQVNCDLNQHLPKKYGVQVIPTLFLIRNGETLGTIINPKDKASLHSWIMGLIG
jgi:thioredoxin 1